MATIRTFIALEIPEDLRATLSRIQQRLVHKTAGIRWVKPENIHLTLKFLGSIKAEKAAEVCEVLDQTARGVSRFSFNISGLGAFPNPRNPKVVWVGIEENKYLWSFQEKLEKALALIGFSKEKRPFAPHLTLGRVKDIKKKGLGADI